MRLVPVYPPTPEVRVQCCVCLRMVPSSEAWADLEGPAFRAYYHDACTPEITAPNPNRRSP